MSTNLKKIRCTLEFNGKTFMISVAPYKRIAYLRQQAQNFFYPITSDIKLVYQNKDITNLQGNLIGDIFRNKEAIYIRMFPIDKNVTNVSTPVQKKKISLGLYRSEPNISNLDSYLVCSCKKGMIEYLCRKCKKYICSNCRKSEEHFYHNVLDIDINNLEESAKLYAITLQSEILYNSKSIKEDYKKFLNANFIEANVRNEIFLRKLQEVQEMYQKMMEIVTLSNEKMNNIDMLINDYQNNSVITNKEIERILIDIYNVQKGKNGKGRRRMTFDEFKDICENLNSKEVNFIEKSSDILSYRINYEITQKVDALYDKLEKILDDVLKYEIPLKLDINSYYTYEIIKNYKDSLKQEEPIQYQEDVTNHLDNYEEEEHEPLPENVKEEPKKEEVVPQMEDPQEDIMNYKPIEPPIQKVTKVREVKKDEESKKKGDCFLPIIPQNRGMPVNKERTELPHSSLEDNEHINEEERAKENQKRFNTISNEDIDYNQDYLNRPDVNENLYKLEDVMNKGYDYEKAPKGDGGEQDDNPNIEQEDNTEQGEI